MKLPWNIQKDPFIRLMDLPRECLSYTLPGSDIRYAVTGDYADRARNHCACICSENLVLYFRSLEEGRAPSPVRMTREERERAKLSKALYRDALFERIHSALGNGPVFSIKKEAVLTPQSPCSDKFSCQVISISLDNPAPLCYVNCVMTNNTVNTQGGDCHDPTELPRPEADL